MGTDKSCGPPSFWGPLEAFEAFWWLLAPLGGFLGFPGASGVKWRGAQNHRVQLKKKPFFIDGTALFARGPFGAGGLPLALNPALPGPGVWCKMEGCAKPSIPV